ncbi:MAG: hypothetical protein NTX64_15270 [Elusimicrobia bacterium]|nr:hypothetical protein [Elusimicrobiota bacterium]
MENQEQKPQDESCEKGKSCCGCKVLAVIGLLIVGGIGGFFAARHCCGSCHPKVCPTSAAPAAQAPATPTPPKK